MDDGLEWCSILSPMALVHRLVNYWEGEDRPGSGSHSRLFSGLIGTVNIWYTKQYTVAQHCFWPPTVIASRLVCCWVSSIHAVKETYSRITFLFERSMEEECSKFEPTCRSMTRKRCWTGLNSQFSIWGRSRRCFCNLLLRKLGLGTSNSSQKLICQKAH